MRSNEKGGCWSKQCVLHVCRVEAFMCIVRSVWCEWLMRVVVDCLRVVFTL